MAIIIESNLCVGCEQCVDECEAGAMVMTDDMIAQCDYEACKECKVCIEVCPSAAITWEE